MEEVAIISIKISNFLSKKYKILVIMNTLHIIIYGFYLNKRRSKNMNELYDFVSQKLYIIH